MKLFKKKTDQPACHCAGSGETDEALERKIDTADRKLTIKVLGAGCKSCHQQYENVKEAVTALGTDADVQYITDMVQVSAYGVMKLPAIVIDEQIVSSGKIVKTSGIVDMLRK